MLASRNGVASLLHPLDAFYVAAGRTPPAAEPVSLGALPEVLVGLLAPEGPDMTARLERRLGGPVVLRVLARRRTRDVYARQVLLACEPDERPVALAALEVRLDRCPSEVARLILEERMPLGPILRPYARELTRAPEALFRLRPDAFMREALQDGGDDWLYGRRTTLRDARRAVLAGVVEVLALATLADVPRAGRAGLRA